MSELIEVYHGTSAHYYGSIEEDGLIVKNHRKHVYVTTDYEVAKHHAFVWTGGLLHEEQELIKSGELDFPMLPSEGIIVTLKVPKELLKTDDYNLEKEPNQYKVIGGISKDYIAEIEEIQFEAFSEEDFDEDLYNSEILRAKCILLGVLRGDD